MQVAKEKFSNLAWLAKEHINIYKAKLKEKLERAKARTKEEKKIAKERRKVKEASAKMKLHKAKARHAEKKLGAKLSHGSYPHPPPATHKYDRSFISTCLAS
ncbi:late embryogenesis abundant protein 6-like [Argentina anserina]|uniref:late embryogenesis abundant protein 6-like n=1 Tax=Argentina anserina TaxID=57926 RepID=UPI0021766FE9|nr:late embryogenesis abundant protein 6-like [Potentilla anserina]